MRILNSKNVLVALLAGTALVGCASIISKSDYPVSITSSPSGLAYTITDKDGKMISSGNTPQTVTLTAGAGYFKSQHYTVAYKTASGVVTREVTAGIDGWYIANILFGGFIGLLIVDPLTGAMYTLPESVNLNIDAVSSNQLPVNGEGLAQSDIRQLKLVSINELNKAQREFLIPVAVN